MNIENASKRLNQFWGKVDIKHIKHLSRFAAGSKVLDLGGGYGSTAHYFQEKGFNITAIDYDETAVSTALKLFPNINFIKANAENLPFEDNEFDTVLLRDALHHFYGEADIALVFNELKRVLKPQGRIIILDPNVQPIMKFLRKLSNHIDEECAYEKALELVDENGFKIIHKSFNTLYSLPLSGGYVGYNFVPNINWLHKIILGSEQFLEKFLQNKLGRAISWRYLIVAENG